jgi:cell wall-associated NlpC family hydrolase
MFGQKAGTPGANPLNSWGQLFHDLGSAVSSPFRHLLDDSGSSSPGLLARVGPEQAAGPTHSSGGKFKGGKPKQAKTGVSAAAVTAVQDAKKELGVPYQYGGESPGVGFDCSGLVQWAYGQAGIALPRTSEDQYAATKGRSIDPSKAQAGDLVFQGGADGSANNPGHVALMASQTQIIEAPHTGLNVRMRAYSDKEWSHVTRPTGGLGGSAALPIGSRSNNPNGPIGNHGLSASAGVGMGAGSYGSSEEVDNVAAALMSVGATSMSGGTSGPTGGTGGGTGGGKSGPISTKGGLGSSSAAQAYAKRMLSKFGWGNDQWMALQDLWNGESGWSSTAWNRSGAYGIAQALGHAHGAGAVGPRSVGSNKPGFNDAYGAQYGLTAQQAKQANQGAYQPQVLWGEGYIKQRYHSPQEALYMWNSRSPHWYAEGTNYAPPGMAWTGERGPELKYISRGDGISTAQQAHDLMQAQKRPAEAMHQAHQPNGLNKILGDGEGVKVDLHFNAGSICINAENKDAQQIAEEFARNVRRVLADDKTFHAVASGRNHG